jgi:c-di-GMP-binding flagellar brake protein YcgR
MHEKRRYQRVPFFCPLRLIVDPSETPMAASSFDISLGGVGLYTTTALNRGQMVRVQFLLRDRQGIIVEEEVQGRVAYCMADESGNRMGIEFSETLRESAQPALTQRVNQL